MEWRWNKIIYVEQFLKFCLNPCSNGMALEHNKYYYIL